MMSSSNGLSQLFSRARATRQRSTGSETRFSCSHVHETHPGKQGFEKRVPHKLMLKNLVDSGDNTDRQQHVLLNCVCMQTEPNEDCRASTKIVKHSR